VAYGLIMFRTYQGFKITWVPTFPCICL